MKSAILFRTALLLILSNTFMTFAWYSHLRNWNDKKWYIAALLSWGIALFEYLFQVPANRLGYTTLSLAQLKVLQEIITLAVFAPFAVLYMLGIYDLSQFTPKGMTMRPLLVGLNNGTGIGLVEATTSGHRPQKAGRHRSRFSPPQQSTRKREVAFAVPTSAPVIWLHPATLAARHTFQIS